MVEGKRGGFKLAASSLLFKPIFLLILLCAISMASIALANHNAVVSLAPAQIYEATAQQFNLSIDNWGSLNKITSVEAAAGSAGFSIINATQYPDWNENHTSSSITWRDGVIATNVKNAVFQYIASAPNVNTNQTYTLTITTRDEIGHTDQNNVELAIINDVSGPVLSSMSPQNGSYIKEGTNLDVSVNAADPDTGVKKVSFAYRGCDNSTTTTLDLSKGENDVYTASASMAGRAEGDYVCFTYNAESNGGATTAYEGRFGFDGTPPTVSLIEPENNALVDENKLFRFGAEDNLAPAIECKLLIDNNEKASLTVNNGETASVSAANITEGSHQWKVSCKDLAGNSGESGQRAYTLDKSSPAIEFIALPSYFARGEDIDVTAKITDTSSINVSADITNALGATSSLGVSNDGNEYSISYPTTMDSAQGYYNVTFYARDAVGHTSSKTAMVLLTYDYIITLSLNPSSAEPNEAVDLTGNVKKDDGSMVPEKTMQLILPSGSVNAPISNSTGNFAYTFNAPDEEGSYIIQAKISAENNVTYTKQVTLRVSNPDDGSGGGSGSSGSGGSGSSGSSISSSSTNSGFDISHFDTTGDVGFVVEDMEAANTEDEGKGPQADETTEGADENEGSLDGETAGVSKAAGFFNLEKLKSTKLLWTLAMLFAIIGVMAYMGRGSLNASANAGKTENTPKAEAESQRNETIEDRFNLTEYLDARNKIK